MDEKLLLRQVRIRNSIKVILIFLGTFLAQMIALILTVGIYIGRAMLTGTSKMQAINELVDFMTLADSSFLMQVSAISASICLVWCGILYYRSSWRVRPFSYREAFDKKNVLGIFLVGFCGCIFMSILLSFFAYFFSDQFTAYNELMSSISDRESVLTLAYVLLIGPVSEELIFRGALLDRLNIAFPFWIANFIQAALFGLYHGNVIQGLYAFGLGICLGVILRATGSIFANILTHIVFNASSFLLSTIFQGKYDWEVFVLFLLFFLSLVFLVAAMKFFVNKAKTYEKMNEQGS